MSEQRWNPRRLLTLLLALGLSMVGVVNAADQGPYEINVIISETGPFAFIGRTMRTSIGIIEGVVNRQGGIRGRPVKFVFHDDQSSRK
jgi:branched-chain amino acid transport system substrate-binding protein